MDPGRQSASASAATGTLSNEPNHQFSLNETWPFVKKYSQAYGFDPHILAGMMQQESAFKNYLVHRDGTASGASAAINRVRDAVLGWDSNRSVLMSNVVANRPWTGPWETFTYHKS